MYNDVHESGSLQHQEQLIPEVQADVQLVVFLGFQSSVARSQTSSSPARSSTHRQRAGSVIQPKPWRRVTSASRESHRGVEASDGDEETEEARGGCGQGHPRNAKTEEEEKVLAREIGARMDFATVAIVFALVVFLPAILVGGIFVWAAFKDGQEDRALQKVLGIRRRTRLGR
ncbi:MAG: hypothetical protein ABI948_09080 [Thermoleophilia bacterium]